MNVKSEIMKKYHKMAKFYDLKTIFKFLELLRQSGIINMIQAAPFLYYGKEFLVDQIKRHSGYGSNRSLFDYDEDEDEDEEEENDEDKFKELIDMSSKVRDLMIYGTTKIVTDSNSENYINNIQRILKQNSQEILKIWINFKGKVINENSTNKFKVMNLQEHIKKVLKEETALGVKLKNLLDTNGIEFAVSVVGGIDNFSKILNLDLDDIKTQEMLVKNFIYHSKLEGIDILFLEINTNKPDKVRIKIHFDTNVYASNVESWVTRTMCEKINKFFPFKATPYWEPVFAGRGVTVVLDSEQIVKEDDEDDV